MHPQPLINKLARTPRSFSRFYLPRQPKHKSIEPSQSLTPSYPLLSHCLPPAIISTGMSLVRLVF
jgi:hypothetical protein